MSVSYAADVLRKMRRLTLEAEAERKQTRKGKRAKAMPSATWTTAEDSEMVTLRIGLWNGHAVHIVTWRDDSTPPLVALVDALGEHDLAELDFAGFKRWWHGAQEGGDRR